jgi:hypothetical protein
MLVGELCLASTCYSADPLACLVRWYGCPLVVPSRSGAAAASGATSEASRCARTRGPAAVDSAGRGLALDGEAESGRQGRFGRGSGGS